MVRVVHLTTVHRPTDTRIFRKQAQTLARHGYDVTLIACAPHSYEDGGVRVEALPPPPSRTVRMTRTALQAASAALRADASIYHFHDPELIPVGVWLKLRGKRVIYDVHEDAAKDVFDKPYLPGAAKPFVSSVVGGVEAVLTRFFDAIVAATPAIARKFPDARTVIVRNVPLRNEMLVPADVPFRSRSHRVVYFGGLAPFNGVEQMVRAMGCLPRDSAIRLSLGGTFSSADGEARMRALPGMERVDYLGWIDRSRMSALFADARAGLVVYQPSANVAESEPTKFYEVLAAGLPLIASDLPHWRRFIDAHRCGVLVPPADPAAIAAALQSLVEDPERGEAMGRRGRALIEGELNWEHESERLLDLYDRLMTTQSSTPRLQRKSA